MSVVISSVTPGSPADKAGLHGGDTLISINDNEIVDVLDYRFYQDVTRPVLKYIDESGKIKKAKIKKLYRNALTFLHNFFYFYPITALQFIKSTGYSQSASLLA